MLGILTSPTILWPYSRRVQLRAAKTTCLKTKQQRYRLFSQDPDRVTAFYYMQAMRSEKDKLAETLNSQKERGRPWKEIPYFAQNGAWKENSGDNVSTVHPWIHSMSDKKYRGICFQSAAIH